MDNLRTVKKEDLDRFVSAVLNYHEVSSAVNFNIRSFYLDFYFSLPSGNVVLPCTIQHAFAELYNRGIITEKPIEDFGAYKTEYKIHVTFIHPFNIVE